MKPEEHSLNEGTAPKSSSPLKDMDSEQRKFTILVALAFLIIFLCWLATWSWQSSVQQQGTIPTQSFFQNTTDYAKPGINALKNTTNILLRRNNSQDQ